MTTPINTPLPQGVPTNANNAGRAAPAAPPTHSQVNQIFVNRMNVINQQLTCGRQLRLLQVD
jgi:hypothetical protein